MTARRNELRVIAAQSETSRVLTRREMMHRLLAGAGAGTAWPLMAVSHPIFEHLKNDAILGEVEKLEKAADWKPVFLSVQQNEALVVLAESIVPGSTKAKVSRFIDLLLSVAKAENQHEFLRSLDAFQTEAQKRFGKSFPSLSEEQKFALLTDAATKLERPSIPDAGGEGRNSVIHAHFENLKGWISGAYYSSEMGMRELGWTGEYVFAEFSGCTHPEGRH